MKVSITAIVAVILLCSVTAEAQQDASDGAPSLLANSSLPLTYNATILEGDEQVCSPQEQLEMAKTEIDEDVRVHIRNSLGETRSVCIRYLKQCYSYTSSVTILSVAAAVLLSNRVGR